MKVFAVLIMSCMLVFAAARDISADTALEPFSYRQDFETRELSAWASYPLWQDTAYDPNIRVNTMVPGDPNIALVQKVTPYTNVDNYAGAQKELDMYFVPGSTVSLRYYLKTELRPEYIKVRLAAGPDKKVDVTIPDPPTNRWVPVALSYNDFIRENPRLAGRDRIKVNALAVLAKFPDADPAMPIFFGLDDITVKGARALAFQFAEPKVFKLSEWKPYIPDRHYNAGDTFTLRGNWPLDVNRVSLTVKLFTDSTKTVYSGELKKKGDEWGTSFRLSFPEGLYHAVLEAFKGGERLSDTEFTIYIAPKNIGGSHPRLWFDAEKKKNWVDARLKTDRFKSVYDSIVKQAQSSRSETPLDKVVFDIDQFPDEDWIPTLRGWSSARIHTWRSAFYSNALAYAFAGDREAGIYAKDMMVKISSFPYILHPWMVKRGRHIYYPVGEFGMDMAMAYDLTYDLMSDTERKAVRDGMMRFIVLGCHQGYVEDDLVTSNTSNWVAHITGGSLMCQAAMYGDGPDVAQLEPYFTGAILKDYDLIQKVTDRDGAYGEGYGYYNFSMLSWSKSLPAVGNVFRVDMSGKLNGSYKETVWAGIVKDKKAFYFGDSGENLRPLTNFAWMLPKYKDPLLGWFYNFMKEGETFMDVLYETKDVSQDDPFDENPVMVFRDVGTTVFKSGWNPDDFVFVLRTGPFVNHQHIDQGSFWLADRGGIFIEERHGSTYYEDPLYQPWYTQPVGHSTILINGNHQSQRVGDLLWHVDGFDDYAFINQFLDGKNAAFTSGDIGRLYWGKVKCLRRNVLYLKPRTLLMLDTAVPGDRDVDVTLLFQTNYLDDITAGDTVSAITLHDKLKLIEDPEKMRGEVVKTTKTPTSEKTLNIRHLYPDHLDVRAVETPHYLYTLQNEKPLRREGMLTVTARTDRVPLVMANLLSTDDVVEPDVVTVKGDGCISGTIRGAKFAFATRPGCIYTAGDIATDALAVTWDDSSVFAALCTSLLRNGTVLIESSAPITCETGGNGYTYCLSCESSVAFGAAARPSAVTVNGKPVKDFSYDAERKIVRMKLPAGEGEVTVGK
ncbi:heparinase II/III-family protein [bacterium]|nr:heparinase II/III-family protein [bacterium]